MSEKNSATVIESNTSGLFPPPASMVCNEHTIVRRHREDEFWRPVYIRNDKRRFDTGFSAGVIYNPVFKGDAPPMYCLPDYDSTGEAHGVIYCGDVDNLDLSVLARTAEVGYDRKKRSFHTKAEVPEQLTKADVLILRANGSALVGWKE